MENSDLGRRMRGGEISTIIIEFNLTKFRCIFTLHRDFILNIDTEFGF